MKKFLHLLLRIALLLAGAVFVASLLLAALLMLLLWLLRSAWARLNGRPVARWTFKVDRQAVWDRFYRRPGTHPAGQRNDADVIDVQVKEKLH
ncbi:MAG: hypothetical protein WCK94_00860 [Comamonadaceae bacterium]